VSFNEGSAAGSAGVLKLFLGRAIKGVRNPPALRGSELMFRRLPYLLDICDICDICAKKEVCHHYNSRPEDKNVRWSPVLFVPNGVLATSGDRIVVSKQFADQADPI
jgi:hypothetical protein